MHNDIVKQPPQIKEEPEETAETQVLSDQPSVIDQPIAEVENNKVDVKPKSRKPIGVIAAAVIVCTGLIGGTIFAGMQASDTGSKVATQTNSAQTVTTPAEEAEQEINAAISEVDGLQEPAQDLSSDLSDATLGL